MNYIKVSDDFLLALIKRNKEWGNIRVPESIANFISDKENINKYPELIRDIKIVLEDRRVTDLSADFWMKMKSK